MKALKKDSSGYRFDFWTILEYSLHLVYYIDSVFVIILYICPFLSKTFR